jgi:hypothetical protein
MKNSTVADVPFRNIEAFVDGTRGQITIGEIPPIRSAVLAAVGKKVRVALLRREKETVSELLQRLDVALGQALSSNTVIDEVLPEIQRRRSR